MIQFHEHIFQMGWFNHQLDKVPNDLFTEGKGGRQMEWNSLSSLVRLQVSWRLSQGGSCWLQPSDKFCLRRFIYGFYNPWFQTSMVSTNISSGLFPIYFFQPPNKGYRTYFSYRKGKCILFFIVRHGWVRKTFNIYIYIYSILFQWIWLLIQRWWKKTWPVSWDVLNPLIPLELCDTSHVAFPKRHVHLLIINFQGVFGLIMTGQPEMRPLLEAYQGKPMVNMVLIALPTFPTSFF